VKIESIIRAKGGKAEREPAPEFAVQVAEGFPELPDRLAAPELREIAVLKLEGCSSEEIAERLQCALRTAERRLRGIRAVRSEEEPRE
jgi:DNA-directed RNA polymerase specialized sigma24 family protein